MGYIDGLTDGCMKATGKRENSMEKALLSLMLKY